MGGLFFWGMKGLLVGMVINTWFCYFVNILLVSKYIGYKWWKQLLDIFPIAAVSLFAALVSYCCSSIMGLDLYPDGVVKVLVYVVVYMGWSVLFKPEAFTFFMTVLPIRKKVK